MTRLLLRGLMNTDINTTLMEVISIVLKLQEHTGINVTLMASTTIVLKLQEHTANVLQLLRNTLGGFLCDNSSAYHN